MKVKNSHVKLGNYVKVEASLGKEYDPKTWNRNIYLDPDETANLSWKLRSQR